MRDVFPPLAIGSIELDDGSVVRGFVAEPRAVEPATEITRYSGWRAWVPDDVAPMDGPRARL